MNMDEIKTELISKPEPFKKRGRPGNPKWTKGVSGNPGGAVKKNAEESWNHKRIVELCRKNAPYAVSVLLDLLHHGEDKVKLKAAEVILDRAYGKADQALVIAGDASNPIVSELILAPRQESIEDWQARRREQIKQLIGESKTIEIQGAQNGKEERN